MQRRGVFKMLGLSRSLNPVISEFKFAGPAVELDAVEYPRCDELCVARRRWESHGKFLFVGDSQLLAQCSVAIRKGSMLIWDVDFSGRCRPQEHQRCAALHPYEALAR